MSEPRAELASAIFADDFTLADLIELRAHLATIGFIVEFVPIGGRPEMKTEFAEQYRVCCIVLDGFEDADDVITKAQESEATFTDPGDGEELLCLRFPGRPQEVYTADALRRALSPAAKDRRKQAEEAKLPKPEVFPPADPGPKAARFTLEGGLRVHSIEFVQDVEKALDRTLAELGFVRSTSSKTDEAVEFHHVTAVAVAPCCSCPTECDCQNPEPEAGVALVSEECPVHNLTPRPSATCPVHGEPEPGD
jgi:hypothetical protein